MKLIFILLTAFMCSSLFAQSNLPVGKYSIGLSVEPSYSYRTLSKQGDSGIIGFIYSGRNAREIAKLGYHFALTLRYKLNDIFQIETGLQYAAKGFRIKRQALSFFPADPAYPTYASHSYNYRYIGIPIIFRALYGKKRVQFSTSLGVAANLLMNVKIKTKEEFGDGHTERNNEISNYDYNKFDLAPMLGVGVNYRMNNKLLLSIEPTFRYSVLPTTETTIRERLWSAGVSTGLFYTLR